MPLFDSPIPNHEAFLSTLMTAYAEVTGGGGEHAQAVRRYWLHGEPLPAASGAWIVRHGRWAPLPQSEANGLYQAMRSPGERYRNPVEPPAWMGADWQLNLLNYVYGQWPAEQWGACRERLRVLLMPVAHAQRLWSLFSRNFADLSLPLDEATWMRGVLADIRATVDRLAAEPAPEPERHPADRLKKALALFDDRQWIGFVSLARWNEVFFVSEMLAFGRRYAAGPQWWMQAYYNLGAGPYHRFETFRYSNTSDAFRTFHDAHIPRLAEGFVHDLEAVRQLLAQPCEASLREILSCRGQLLDALAGHPAGFAAMIERLTAESARHLVLSETVAERNPQGWLAAMQAQFRLTGTIGAARDTGPESLAWLRGILPELAQERSRGDIIALVGQHEGAQTLADLAIEHLGEASSLPSGFLKPVEDPAILDRLLAQGGTLLKHAAATRYVALGQEHPEHLEAAYRASEAHPQVFLAATFSPWANRGDSAERWARVWPKLTADADRTRFVYCLIGAIDGRTLPGGLALLDAIDRSDPERVATQMRQTSNPAAVLEALAAGSVRLQRHVPALVAASLKSGWFDSSRPDVDPVHLRRGLQANPEGWTQADDRVLARIVHQLDDATLIACADAVRQTLETSRSKPLMRAMVAMLAQRSLAALHEAGLMTSTHKAVRQIVLQALAVSIDPAAAAELPARVSDEAVPEYIRGLALDRMEAAGRDVSALDPFGGKALEDFQTLAAPARIPAAVTVLWNDAFAGALQRLGEPLGRWLLWQTSLATDTAVPRVVRQVLALIPEAARRSLAEAAVGTWIAQAGAEKVQWLALLVTAYGDDRVVTDLARAVKTWSKGRKQKAQAALHLMCSLAGSFGPAQAKAILESRKFSPSILEAAREALAARAEQEGVDAQTYLRELVPDFGLTTEGLVLDTGARRYVAKILPDLSVKVLTPAGKLAASLPKLADGDDPERYSLIESQLKTLKKNLKPLAKQQLADLARALMTGRTWTQARWQRLFIDHPLLCVLGQGLIWTRLDADGNVLGQCRPTESRTLIDLDDVQIVPGADERLQLTHPVTLSSDALAAWQVHLDDYAVTQPLVQMRQPAFALTPEETEAMAVLRHQGHVVGAAELSNTLEKHGYVKGQSEDGGYIHEHSLTLGDGPYVVLVVHSGMPAWFDPGAEVAIDRIEILTPQTDAAQRGDDDGEPPKPTLKPTALGRLPPCLVSSVIHHSAQVAARGKGYRDNWVAL